MSWGRRIREQLGLEEAERVVPTGSMWPAIRAGEAIRFRRSEARPRPGEIWVAERGALHIVHRVLWVRGDGSALLKGDWAARSDGWLAREQLFGPVSMVRRRGRWRRVDRLWQRTSGLAWCLLAGLGKRTWARARTVRGRSGLAEQGRQGG